MLVFIINFFLIIIGLLLIYIIYILSYSILFGAPFAVTRKPKMEKMLDMLRLKPGDKFADLGSGDGRIVIAAARRGAQAHGYELNPILVLVARRKIKKAHLEHIAYIHRKSYWDVSLKNFTAVTVFGIKHIMPSLEKKLDLELKKNSLVVSNHFKFPKWKIYKKEENLYLYKK